MLSELAPYNSRSHFSDGLLEVIRILGTYITPNPDDAFDSMSAENYQHGNRTIADDLLEEIIIRLDEALGGGGGVGSTPPEILRSNADLSGAVPAGYTYGYNYSSGKLYIKNFGNNWQLIYDPSVSLSLIDGVNSTVETSVGGTFVNVLVNSDNADPDIGYETLDLDNNLETDEHPSNLFIRNNSNISLVHGLKASAFDGKIVILHNAGETFPVLLIAKSSLTTFAPFTIEEDYPLFPGATVMLVYREGKWSPINGEAAWSSTPGFTTQVINDFFTVNNSDKLTFFVQSGGSNFLRTGTPGLQGILVHRVTNTTDKAACVAGSFGFGAGSNNLIVGGSDAVLKFSALVAYEILNDSTQEFQHNIGFMRNGNQTPVNGIYFRYNNSGSEIDCICASSGGETLEHSGFTPTANTFFYAKILVYPDASKVLFLINGSIVATITTDIPIGGGNEFTYGSSLHKLNGSTNRDVCVDFIEFKALTNRRY